MSINFGGDKYYGKKVAYTKDDKRSLTNQINNAFYNIQHNLKVDKSSLIYTTIA